MKEPGDKISVIDLEKSWKDILSTFDLMVENGHKLRPIRFLIRYINEKGYSSSIFAGSSLFSLLISLPNDMTIDFTKTLRIGIDQQTSTVKFTYHCELPRPDKPQWIETCQLTEIADTFEYFIESQNDWIKIKNKTREQGAYEKP